MSYAELYAELRDGGMSEVEACAVVDHMVAEDLHYEWLRAQADAMQEALANAKAPHTQAA